MKATQKHIDMIDNVSTEYSGFIVQGELERIESFIEEWLFDRRADGIELAKWVLPTVDYYVEEVGVSKDEAIAQAIVEMGHQAYLESVEHIATGVDTVHAVANCI